MIIPCSKCKVQIAYEKGEEPHPDWHKHTLCEQCKKSTKYVVKPNVTKYTERAARCEWPEEEVNLLAFHAYPGECVRMYHGGGATSFVLFESKAEAEAVAEAFGGGKVEEAKAMHKRRGTELLYVRI